MENMVVGLDIGGTAVKGVLLSTSGETVRNEVIATCHEAGQEEFVASLCDFAHNLARGYTIKTLGLGIAGLLDRERTMLLESPNLPGLQWLPLKNMLEQRLMCPVIIENDANVAALGELRAGAGRGHSNFLFFTLGTGIGSGIILNKSLWMGEQGKAGEFGHMTIDPGGQVCGCGRRGCLEAYSSGTAIVRMARLASLSNEDSALHEYADDLAAITPKVVYQYALNADRACCIIFETMARGLASAIADVNNLLDIHTFIVGGGISMASDFFIPMVMEALDQKLFTMSRGQVTLIRAQLGNDAGVLGAGYMALDRLEDFYSHV
jgi:glucokinase